MSALVIGYGNPLRGDDGLGWHVVEGMLRDGCVRAAHIFARHQLTPELAGDVAEASTVVFVDARPADGLATRIEAVGPDRTEPNAWTHRMTPSGLLGLAVEVYGHAPPAWLVTAPAACTDASDELSDRTQALLPEVVAAVEGLLGH